MQEEVFLAIDVVVGVLLVAERSEKGSEDLFPYGDLVPIVTGTKGGEAAEFFFEGHADRVPCGAMRAQRLLPSTVGTRSPGLMRSTRHPDV